MERIVWIGPAHAAAERAREALSRAGDSMHIVTAPTMAAASPHLAALRPVVVVDAAGSPEWARMAEVLRLSAPTATLVAWSARSDHDALEDALAGGFDGSVAGDADWTRPLRWARARAASRTRLDRQSQYHVLFARTRNAALIMDAQGRVLALNPSFSRLLGYAEGEFEGRSVLEIFPAEGEWHDRPFFEEVLAGRSEGHRGEGVVIRRDGTERWVELHLFAGGAADEHEYRFFAILQDITDRKHADASLREREERFHAAFAHSGVPMSMVEVVESWVYANPALQAMFGVPPQMSVEQLIALTHPEDRLIDVELYHEMIDGRRESYQIEKRYVHPATGATVWCLLIVSLERDAAGAPRRVFSTVLDIHDRKRAEEALRASEVSIRALHEIAASDLTGQEKIGRILEVGRARFGISTGVLSRISGDSFEVIESATESPALARGTVLPLGALFCAHALREQAPVAIEHASESDWSTHPAYAVARVQSYLGTTVIVDGEVFGTLCFGSYTPRPTPFTDADRDFLQLMSQWIGGQLGRARAEAALREREEELRHSQKMEAVGRLAGGVAHDFNNLLMGIKGHVELLLQNADWEDGVLEDLFEINHAAVRSQRLVQQLMAFSRKQVLQPEVLDLNALVEDMSRMLDRLLGEHVRLVCDLDPALGRVTADQGQLEQVLVNLAVNARDAMQQGGTLSIHTRNDECADLSGPAVVLTVTDTGTGMDAWTQEHVFEPFFTTKDADKGTGLGLATVYGIVKQSGGVISVESALGEGTTFRICLPRSAPGAAHTRPAVPVGSTAHRVGSETVLLVEDEKMIRKLTRRMLQQCGYEVIDVAGGPEALEICRAHDGPIHLLLTDIVMPQIRGRELARQVALLRPDVRILYMSGYTGDQALDLADLEGEAAFLQKPVDLDTLACTVRGLLDLPIAAAK